MKVVFVYGPTCSGKTELGIRLAEDFGGEILSCDSVQVYKHIDIGSAKPNKSELARAKHHLVDFVDYPRKYNAADFREDALSVLKKLEQQGHKLVYVVGGTGFYFQALEKGMSEAPSVDSGLAEAIRLEAESDLSKLWEELVEGDRTYSEKIASGDTYRICRAIELLRSGYKASELFRAKESNFPYPLYKIFLNPERDQLRKRMDQRTMKMLEAGLVNELKQLRAQGYTDWTPLSSVGYKEVGEFLDSKIEQSELAFWISTRSMQLAKRQRTWFARDKEALEITAGLEQWDFIRQNVKVFLGS